jgi:hypothetical protein
LKDVDEATKLNIAKFSDIEKKYFDELLYELGNFQDKVTSITLLEEEWLQPLNTFNLQILMHIKKTITADKNTIKNDLINKLQREIISHREVFQNSNICLVSRY